MQNASADRSVVVRSICTVEALTEKSRYNELGDRGLLGVPLNLSGLVVNRD